MRKNIYFLINSLEWWWAERVIINVTEKLSEDHNITIFTLKDVNFYKLPENVFYYPLSRTKSNIVMLLLFPWYIYKLKKIFSRSQFDDGVSFLELSNFIHILSNKIAKISIRVSLDYYKHSSFLYKRIINFFYKKAHKIIVNSDENKYDLAVYLEINENKIIAIHNPVNFKKIEILKKENPDKKLLKIIEWRKVFITVGRLVWQKHHNKLIDSFKRVYSELDTNWIYLIIGDWPERTNLERKVRELWLGDNIFFLWEQENVFRFLNIADYFVYASEIEWFPNVLIEAMACNLPIITSDFKSWAQECILGDYNKNTCKSIKYPYFWSNGALLDLKDYENEFLEIYKNLDKVKQEKKGFEKFETQFVADKWVDLFTW